MMNIIPVLEFSHMNVRGGRVNSLDRAILRLSFESARELLKDKLHNDGFEVGGTTDFQKPVSGVRVTNGKYQMLAIYHPFLYKEMLMLSSFEGTVLPCTISIIELYPGETAVVPYNATEYITREMSFYSLESLATRITEKLDNVIHTLVSSNGLH